MRDDCLLIDERIGLPTHFCQTVLDNLHPTQPRSAAMLDLCQHAWFPHMQRSIVQVAQGCIHCSEQDRKNLMHPPLPADIMHDPQKCSEDGVKKKENPGACNHSKHTSQDGPKVPQYPMFREDKRTGLPLKLTRKELQESPIKGKTKLTGKRTGGKPQRPTRGNEVPNGVVKNSGNPKESIGERKINLVV